MDPNPIDIGGKLVRRWSGWYYVEMFDNSNGNPMGMYLSPPSYEDFAGLYQSSTVKDLAGVLTDSREVGDDIQMDVNQTFFSLRG
jgi:hypothetical protein